MCVCAGPGLQPETLFATSGLLTLHHLLHFVTSQGRDARVVCRDFVRASVPLVVAAVGVTQLVFNLLQVPSDIMQGQVRDRTFWRSPLVRFLCCCWHPRALEDVVAIGLRACGTRGLFFTLYISELDPG